MPKHRPTHAKSGLGRYTAPRACTRPTPHPRRRVRIALCRTVIARFLPRGLMA